MSSRPKNAVYDILKDEWSFLPTLTPDPEQFPCLFYQRFSTTIVQKRFLLAFWLKITASKSYYAKLDLMQIDKGWTVDYVVNKGGDLYGVGE